MLHHHRGGSGEPLVLIHGIGSHHGVWSRLLPALEARHEVLAVDSAGFGASPDDGLSHDIATHADRFEGFFAEAGIERPHVCGWSMGGGIALELGRRGAVRSVVAVAPVGFWLHRELAYAQAVLQAAHAAVGALQPYGPAIARTPVGRAATLGIGWARPWALTEDEALATIENLAGAAAFRPALHAFTTHVFPAGDPAGLRDLPVTVVWGTRDAILLPRQARRAARALPWATHVTVAGAGHGVMQDDVPALTQAVVTGARTPAPVGV